MLYASLSALVLSAHLAEGAQKVVTSTTGVAKWSVGTYGDLTAAVCDTLVFNYNAYHDVIKMSDGTCGPTGNTELANNAAGGGTSPNPNKYTYTVQPADGGSTLYFSCSYAPAGSYGHCTNGQKLKVTVAAAGGTASCSP